MPKTKTPKGPGELDSIPENELVAIETLLPDPSNPQDHPPDSIEAIAASLAEYGQQKPVVYDERGVLIAGHGTVEAAKALGWARVWAVRSDLEGTKRVGFQIADNQTAKRAVWNEHLPRLLRALQEEGADMEALGFFHQELARLLGAPEDDEGGESEPGPGLGPDAPVRFAFGEYGALVDVDLYEAFEKELLRVRERDGEALLSDVLREILEAADLLSKP